MPIARAEEDPKSNRERKTTTQNYLSINSKKVDHVLQIPIDVLQIPTDSYSSDQLLPTLQTQTSWHFPVEFALGFDSLQTETNAHTVHSAELHKIASSCSGNDSYMYERAMGKTNMREFFNGNAGEREQFWPTATYKGVDTYDPPLDAVQAAHVAADLADDGASDCSDVFDYDDPFEQVVDDEELEITRGDDLSK